MSCICAGPGYCFTYGKLQSPRLHQICANQVLTPGQCEVYRTNWAALALARGYDSLACRHRGDVIARRTQKVEKKGCGECARRGDTINVFECKLHAGIELATGTTRAPQDLSQRGTALCTLAPWQPGQAEHVCRDCPDRDPLVPRVLARHRIAPEQLLPSRWQFNNSIVPVSALHPAPDPCPLTPAPSYLMAYRLGWDNARVALAELDADYNVLTNQVLPLGSGQCQEDPRLFVFRGQLHVAFTAVNYKRGNLWTDVAYARLARRASEGFSSGATGVSPVSSGGTGVSPVSGWRVAQEFAPHYPGRNPWEKNWGFFEHEQELYCVYSVRPHRVLHVSGDTSSKNPAPQNPAPINTATLISESACEYPGKIGRLHGGAAPVLHAPEGGPPEFYNFYHSQMGDSQNKVYAVELYTFQAQPPFKPSRYVRLPLLLPTFADRPESHVPHCVFPGGAFLKAATGGRGPAWLVSFGYYDKWSEVVTFDAADVEACLEPLPH